MKQRLLNVIPECYVDTNLIEYLLNASVNHQHSCTKVVGLLNGKFKDQFAVGIIDRDKVQLGYIRECDEIASTEHLCLLKHRVRNQYLITVSPAVDGFILDCIHKEGIELSHYGFPAALKDFIKVTKAVTSNSDARFKALFRALKGNSEFIALKASLKYLVKNGFKTDVNALRGIFQGEG